MVLKLPTLGLVPILLSAASLLLPCPALAVDHAVLFVGNSYTSANSPESLAESYRQLVLEGEPGWTDVSVAAVAPGGRDLAGHYLQAGLLGTNLHGFLTDSDPDHQWDFVVLQDQSQIPGFPAADPSYVASRDAAVGLAALIDQRGAETRLFMTWGRFDGDPQNQSRYPDFPTMQGHLADGYDGYRVAIEAAGYPVEVVPVGLGWRQIYDELVAQDQDPHAASTLFSRLYTVDGSHPSVHGTYLSACVLYAFLTGQSPVGPQWAHAGIDGDDRLVLQQVADRLLNPGVGDDDDDASPGDDDSAGDDDDNDSSADDDDDNSSEDDDDSAGDDDSADDDDGGRTARRDTGCSCGLGEHDAGAAALLLLVVLAVRRRLR